MRPVHSIATLCFVGCSVLIAACSTDGRDETNSTGVSSTPRGGSELAFPYATGAFAYGYLHIDDAAPPVVLYEVVDGVRVLEGDIILDAAMITPIAPGETKHALATTPIASRLWPGGVVPYEIAPGIASATDALDGMNHVEQHTAIRFVQRSSETNYVRFVDGAGCSSFVGRIGGEQAITLNVNCGFGAAVHEVLHALGSWHEQQRTDRDAHVDVRYQNIIDGYAYAFDPYHTNAGTELTAYDLGSIMHYGSYAFSKNGKATIVRASTGQPYQHNRAQLSALDIEGVRALYAAEACGCQPSETCNADELCVYFLDVPIGSTHAGAIDKLLESGITKGCGTHRYCPKAAVTREQMATFLTRALSLMPRAGSHFTDVASTNVHANNIYAIYDAGITYGCGPTTYCPDDPVTRAQMASFLVRGLGLPPANGSDFTDISGNTHEAAIEALAAAGITKGCGPTTYCPDDPVTREQMASFLVRALNL